MRLGRLVVFIPGIGGSVLSDADSDDVVWSHGLGTLSATLRDPGRLDLDRPLVARGLLQDIQVVPWWTAVQGYTDLWHQLRGLPGAIADDATHPRPNPDANVIAFPYDFRRSVRDSAQALDARVREQLRALGRPDERDSVTVVAHSLGGLVARYWIAKLGGHEVCHGLLTLGTPHRGAPKALDVAANGLRLRTRLGDLPLHRLSDELRRWPSLAELLPRYPCIEDPRAPGGLYVHDLSSLDPRWDGIAAMGKDGWDVHQEIETGWQQLGESAPVFQARVGVAQPTLQSATLRAGHLDVGELAPVWCDLGIFVNDAGDGTVPAISGFPVEVEDDRSYELVVSNLPVSHGRIGNDEWATRFVELREGWSLRTGARGAEARVGLGVVVPDLTDVGTDVEVRVRLTSAADLRAPLPTVRIEVHPTGPTAEHGAGGRVLKADWDEAGGEYVAVLTDLAEGYWTVQASAKAVPGAGDLATSADFGVVDLDQVEP